MLMAQGSWVIGEQDFRGYEMVPLAEPVPMPLPSPEHGGAGGEECAVGKPIRSSGPAVLSNRTARTGTGGLLCRGLGVPRGQLRVVGVSAGRTQLFNNVAARGAAAASNMFPGGPVPPGPLAICQPATSYQEPESTDRPTAPLVS
jgi:hypothetical protein